MNKRLCRAVIVMITLGITATAILGNLNIEFAKVSALITPGDTALSRAPPAITGDNVYVAWWTNKTGINEVMFRASTDGGKTFGDKINLSNTTNADSTRVEIDSDANSVVVTWWETNQTSDMPVMKVSNDSGKTFGPTLKLAANGTIGG
jgi:hypothetical protein